MFCSCFRLKPDLPFICWSPGLTAWTAVSEMYSSLGNRVEIQRSSSEKLVNHPKWIGGKNTLVKWLVSSCLGELLSAQPDNTRPPFLMRWAELLHRWEISRENPNNLWTSKHLILVGAGSSPCPVWPPSAMGLCPRKQHFLPPPLTFMPGLGWLGQSTLNQLRG